MSQTTKLFLVGILCFSVGAGSLFAWVSYSEMQRENAQLKTQLEETVTQPETIPSAPDSKKAVVEISPTPTSQNDEKSAVAQVGSITGTLGYPSQGIPPLEVFAIKASDHSVYFKTVTKTNQQTFTIDDITPGTYVVVAYPVDTDSLAGGYTKAVACGLSVECTDHSLVLVEVTAGGTQSNIEVKDWYAPSGEFPAKP